MSDDLRCTYCGSELYIIIDDVVYEGPSTTGEIGSEVSVEPVAIECNGVSCHAVWEPNGSLREPGLHETKCPVCRGTIGSHKMDCRSHERRVMHWEWD